MDILLVEDNPGDIRLLEELFAGDRFEISLHVVSDGDDALEFANQRGEFADAPRPDLVLLDWNLPRVDGVDVLAELKSEPPLQRVPVIVLTGSDADAEIRRAYDNRANAVITKPVDPDEFSALAEAVETFWTTFAHLPTENESDESNV